KMDDLFVISIIVCGVPRKSCLSLTPERKAFFALSCTPQKLPENFVKTLNLQNGTDPSGLLLLMFEAYSEISKYVSNNTKRKAKLPVVCQVYFCQILIKVQRRKNAG